MTKSINISRFVALLGSLITLIQIFFQANDQEGICLNDGCKVVDSLTAVPPIYFNIGGFLFFQAIFWGLWLSRSDKTRLQYVNMLLLAGLAAEAVLVSFQHLIAQTFCSYCLIIFGLILLLNILAGLRHLLTGAAVFFAVILGFMSLQFSGSTGSPLQKLDAGTFAQLKGTEEEKRYLFFSSTCKYCEQVIESLQEETVCGLSFNPLDTITDFALAKAERQEKYNPAVNRKVLQSLGIEQIPVLLVSSSSGYRIITGSKTIQDYLSNKCFTRGAESPDNTTVQPGQTDISVPGVSGVVPGTSGLDFLPPQDDSCSVSVDCEDPDALLPAQ